MARSIAVDSELDVHTAVLLCTDFTFLGRNDNHFYPTSVENLIYLHLKIGGKSLLENSLITLREVGIQHVIITAYCDDIPKIKSYISELKSKSIKNLSLKYVEVFSNSKDGDALRSLFDSGYIRKNFLIFRPHSYCDSNQLNLAIEAFNIRHSSKNASQIMTKIYADAPLTSQFRNENDNFIIAINDKSNCLLYHELNPMDGIDISQELSHYFSSSQEIRLRYDILDPKIEICTPELLKLVSKTPELMLVNEDIISAVIENQRRSNSIFTYILLSDELPNCYIDSFRIYYHVIIDQAQNHINMRNISKRLPNTKEFWAHRTAIINTPYKISGFSSIDFNTEIESDCIISGTSIGRGCKIGKNCAFFNSILGDNVTVGSGVKIFCSFIDDKVNIEKDVLIENGSIIGVGVEIETSTHIKPNSILSLSEQPEMDKVDKYLGNFLFNCDELSDNDSLEENHDQLTLNSPNLPVLNEISSPNSNKGHYWNKEMPIKNKFSWMGQNISENFELYETTLPHLLDDLLEEEEWSQSQSEQTDLSGSDDYVGEPRVENPDVKQSEEFISQITDMTLQSINSPKHTKDKILEMKSMRLAYNVSDFDVALVMLPVVVEFLSLNSFGKTLEFFESYVSEKNFESLFDSFIRTCSEKESKQIFSLILNFATQNPQLPISNCPNPLSEPHYFCTFMEHLYHTDLFDFDTFTEWFHQIKSQIFQDSKITRILQEPRLVAFVGWLEQDDE